MSKINNPIEYSITDFVQNIYSNIRQPILFWDTCSLLEVFRFPYRGGNIVSYQTLNRLNGLIQNNNIYSLASSLTITEWNDNEDKVKSEVQDSLTKTGAYHDTCIQIINEIFTTTYSSEPLHDKGLVQSLEALADSILSKTIFLQTNEIANDALERVRDKRPPASKKQEFKDCTVWETTLRLSRSIYAIETVNQQVFYTVNIDDFVDKSRDPKIFHGILLTEASLSNLVCCSNLLEVNAVI
jgi:hypothetical protein